jgi:hypothetical protein
MLSGQSESLKQKEPDAKKKKKINYYGINIVYKVRKFVNNKSNLPSSFFAT